MSTDLCPLRGTCSKPCPSEDTCIVVGEKNDPCGRLWTQIPGQPRHNLPMPCILPARHGGDVHRDPLGREWPTS